MPVATGDRKIHVAHFRLGDWIVKPQERVIQREAVSIEIGVRSMDVLVHLAERAGEVVSAEELLIECWRGTFYGDNPVHKAITELRKHLGDQAQSPVYIATIRKRGYRLLVPVSFPENFAGLNAPAAAVWTEGSPFRGLEAFDSRHAAVFFGRSSATAQVLQSLRVQIDAGCAFLLCVGPSGCGKTSLMRAGVLPLLQRPGGFDGIAACSVAEANLVGGNLSRALAHAMMAWAVGDRPVFTPSELESLVQDLDAEPEAVAARLLASLQWLPPVAATHSSPVMFVLVVDALEGMFANPLIGERERAAFARVLDVLARCGHVLVLATCRNDFYPRVVELPALVELKRGSGLYDVGAVSRGEIAQMIRRPAQAAALTFERDARTQELLDDVIRDAAGRNPESLPLLQYTLQELYARRSDVGLLSFEAYREIGGLEGALGKRAEAIYQQMDAGARSALPWLLQQLVNLQADEESVTGRKVAWASLRNEAAHRLVQGLVDARLLVSELVFDEPVVSVAHEALLHHWPRVVEWIDDNRSGLQVRARLAVVASRWEREARRRDLLLPRGRLLDEAKALLQNPAVSLADYELTFVHASGRNARWAQRMRVLAVSLIAVLGVMAIAAAAVAIRARHDAELRRASAEGLVDFMLGDLSERLTPLGRLDLLDSVSAQALHYLSDTQSSGLDRETLMQRAKALLQIGDIRLSRSDSKNALIAFTQAMAVLDQLQGDMPDDPEVLDELGKANFWIGAIHFREHDMDGAGKSFNRYREAAARRDAIDPHNPDAWLELSYAYNNLGTLAGANDRQDEAIADFQRSIELKRKVLQVQPANDGVVVELADSFSWVGTTLQLTGKLATAGGYYQQELDALSTARIADPTASAWRLHIANAHSHIAQLAVLTGNVALARQHFDAARTILSDITAKQPDNTMWQHNLAILNMDTGDLQLLLGNPAQAQPLLTEATAKLTALVHDDPSFVDWKRQLALCHRYLAQTWVAMGRTVEALSEANSSIELIESIKSESSKTPAAKAALAQALLVRGEVEQATGQHEAANGSWGKAFDLLVGLAPGTSDSRILEPWVRVLGFLHRQDQAAPFVRQLAATGFRKPDTASMALTTRGDSIQ
jgi:eukaryotic-like serine/threonine-protein kinase